MCPFMSLSFCALTILKCRLTHFMSLISFYTPAGIYLLKVNNRYTRTRYEICSKLTIKIPERRHSHRSGVFIVNFKHISLFSSVSVVNFEHVVAGRDQLKITENY